MFVYISPYVIVKKYNFALCMCCLCYFIIRKGSVLLYMMKVNWNGWNCKAKYENFMFLVQKILSNIFIFI